MKEERAREEYEIEQMYGSVISNEQNMMVKLISEQQGATG